MPKRYKRKYDEWRKPRFNRSHPKIIRGKAAKEAGEVRHVGSISGDNTASWKPISQETFEELVERGLLSQEQIKQYHKRREAEYERNPKKSKAAKIKKHKNFALVVEISKHDLTTVEGLKAFQKILEENPEALHLIAEAQKLRAANE